ncbi:hypothetical protein MRX96_002356 [Rhipicephalus microplus]
MEAPTDIAGVRQLLRMVNHLARFLPCISEVTALIRALLNKSATWGGVLQRNRRHLVPFAPPAPRVEPPPSEQQEPERTLPPLEPQRTTTVQPPDSLGLPPADSDRSDGVTRTRSGRRVVPPNRLNL